MYNRLFSSPESLDFILFKTFCIIRPVAAVGSVVSRLKHSIFNNAIHFLVYLAVSNIATPLPFDCFKIKVILFLDRLYVAFLYLH